MQILLLKVLLDGYFLSAYIYTEEKKADNVDEETRSYVRKLINAENQIAEGKWLDVARLISLVEGDQLASYQDRVLTLLDKGFEPQSHDSTSSFFNFDLPTYNHLIKSLAERGHLKHAYSIADHLGLVQKKRYRPNLETFMGLLEGYKRDKNATGAMELMDKMKALNNHLTLDPAALHSLVMLGKDAGEGLAFKLFEESQKYDEGEPKEGEGKKEERPKVVPMVETFNELIDCCAQNKDLEKLMEVRERMDADGVKENSETFNGMLKLMKERKDIEGALQVYTEMRDIEVPPNINTYNILLKLFATTRDLEKAVAIISTMEKEVIKMDAQSYSSLVELNVLREDWDKAGRILRMMKEKGFALTPDTFTGVLQVLLSEMNESQALLVLKFIKQQGVVLETDALILLLDHFGRNDRLDIFLIELRQFELEGLKHRKDSLHILLRLSVAKENLDLIYLYLQKMKRMGEKMVQDTLNDLKLLLYRQKRTEGIERLFNLVDDVMSATGELYRREDEDKDLPYALEERIRRVTRPRKSRKAKEEEDRLRAKLVQQQQEQQQQQQQQASPSEQQPQQQSSPTTIQHTSPTEQQQEPQLPSSPSSTTAQQQDSQPPSPTQ